MGKKELPVTISISGGEIYLVKKTILGREGGQQYSVRIRGADATIKEKDGSNCTTSGALEINVSLDKGTYEILERYSKKSADTTNRKTLKITGGLELGLQD